MKIFRFLPVVLTLLAYSAVAQPILTKTVLLSFTDLSNHVAAASERVSVLSAYNTNYPFGQAVEYRIRADLSTNLHNPPFYFREKNGRGVWEADIKNARYLDGRFFGMLGDGSTDNSIAFQNAINGCISNNIPELWIPPGTNVIGSVSHTGSLLVGGLAIRGTPGMRSIIRANSSATMLKFTSVRNFSLKDLWLDGNYLSTNIVEFNDATQCPVTDNIFYNGAGTGLRWTGPQNYGHDVSWNNFVNMTNCAIVADATSVAAVNIADNVIQTSGGAYTNVAKGIWLRGGVANVVIYHNIIQRVYRGVELDGNNLGSALANGIDFNYFEATADVPIKLNGALHVMLKVTRNFFNQLLTPSGWSVSDSAGTTLYGFTYEDNTITPDAGKALSLTNSLVRGWRIRAASSDVATDYQLPNVANIFDTPSQRLESLQITNFTVSAGVTNLAIAGDLLPNRLEFSANSNAYVSVSGFIYPNTKLTLYNAGTNELTFAPTLHQVRPATEDTFVYRNSAWRRERLSYLPDSGGTIYGTLDITNNLNVYNDIMSYSDITANGLIQNPWAYISYGSYGSTNLAVFGAKPGAVVGLIKDGNYYVWIGTNGVTKFTTPIEISAATNVFSHFLGFATGDSRIYSMTREDVSNHLGIVVYTATNGILKTGNSFAFNGAAGTNITLTTNGSGQVVIAAAGTTYTEGNGISISGATISVDLAAGSGIGFSTNGAGQITISNTGTNSGAGSTNGSALYIDSAYAQTGNFIDSPEIDPSISGTNVTLSIVANSVGTNKLTTAAYQALVSRANHTGTQTASTISDFADTQWANFTNSMVASNNVSFAYDTSNKKLMISSTGTGGSATNAPTIAVDGVNTTNVNFADSSELLVTQTGTNVTYALATSGVTAGTYSNSTVTVDAKGRVTAISTGSGGGVYTNTTDQIWRTIAGVRFMVTNLADAVDIDTSKTSYSGVGTNLAISGSNDRNSAIFFTLEFSPVRTDTNYLVFADIESSEGVGSATVFVDDSDGRRTNYVKFGIVATTGTVNFNMSGKFVRVWAVDPNTLISGDQITSLSASLITSGTLDVARLPSDVLLESEAASWYGSLSGNNTWTGVNTFTNDVTFQANATFNTITTAEAIVGNWTVQTNLIVGNNLTVTNAISAAALTVTNDAYSASWNGSTNVPTKDALYDKIETLGAANSNVVINGVSTPARFTNSATVTIATNVNGDITLTSTASGGSVAVNGSGSATNLVDTDTTAWTLTSGAAYASNRFPQVFMWTNAVVTNWTFPVGTRLFKVHLIGGGGGGGSGRKGLTNTVVCGGGGAGGGAYSFAMIPVEALGTNLSITITNGAGGIGGGSQVNNSSNGTNGTAGGFSSFGNLVIASGGGGGGGGTASSGFGGSGGSTFATTYGIGGQAALTTGGSGAAGTDANSNPYWTLQYGAVGGGSAGGITTNGVASGGGRGGQASTWAIAAKGGQGYGTGGFVGGAAAQSGFSAHTALFCGGSGGGGGASSVTGNGGAGGNGGRYGGGGGGGGAAGDGIGNSGAGGNGADGIVMVICE